MAVFYTFAMVRYLTTRPFLHFCYGEIPYHAAVFYTFVMVRYLSTRQLKG